MKQKVKSKMKIGQLVGNSNEKVKQAFGMNRRKTIPNPENDGTTHINIESQASTQLGRFIASGSASFKIEPFGEFKTINGFILYVMVEPLDEYRYMNAGEAFHVIRQRHIPDNHLYQAYVKDAYRAIFKRNKRMQKLLIENTLPFISYYLRVVDAGQVRNIATDDANGKFKIPVRTRRDSWLPDMIADLAEEFRQNKDVTEMDGDYRSVINKIGSMMEEVKEPVKDNVDTVKAKKHPKGNIVIRHRYIIDENDDGEDEATSVQELKPSTDNVIDKKVDNSFVSGMTNVSAVHAELTTSCRNSDHDDIDYAHQHVPSDYDPDPIDYPEHFPNQMDGDLIPESEHIADSIPTTSDTEMTFEEKQEMIDKISTMIEKDAVKSISDSVPAPILPFSSITEVPQADQVDKINTSPNSPLEDGEKLVDEESETDPIGYIHRRPRIPGIDDESKS